MAIAQKLKKVISIVSEMDESSLDALLLLLQKPLGEDYELSNEDILVVNERMAAYTSGKDKGVPALEASKRIKAKLKVGKK